MPTNVMDRFIACFKEPLSAMVLDSDRNSEIEFSITGSADGVDPLLFKRFRDYYMSEYPDQIKVYQIIDTELLLDLSDRDMIERKAFYRKRKIKTRNMDGSMETRLDYQKKVLIDKHEETIYGVKLTHKHEDQILHNNRSNDIRPNIESQYIRGQSRRLHRVTYEEDQFKIDMTTITLGNNRVKYQIELELTNLVYPDIGYILESLAFNHSLYNSDSFRRFVTPLVPTVIELDNHRKLIDQYINPVELRDVTANDLRIGSIVHGRYQYKVGLKNDGERRLLVCDSTGIWLSYRSINRLMYRWQDIDEYPGKVILDGELMLDCDDKKPCTGKSTNVREYYMVFDCVLAHDRVLSNRLMDKRLQYIRDESQDLLDLLNSVLSTGLSADSQFIFFKEYRALELSSYFKTINEMIDKLNDDQYQGITDGLILVPTCSYSLQNKSNRDISIAPAALKWKPSSIRTIDLLCRHNGDSYDLFAFDPSYFNKLVKIRDCVIENVDLTLPVYHDVVLEFAYDNGILTFMRKRTDKLNPNSKRIFDDFTKSDINSITQQDLTGESMFYIRKLHNRIKSNLYQHSSLADKGKVLLDIGSGNLGDLGKWGNYGVVIAVEPDEINRQEARRRLELMMAKGLKVPKVFILPFSGEDTENIVDMVNLILAGGRCDEASMMLSASYFSKDGVPRVCETIRRCVKDESDLLLFTIDGNAVKKLITEKSFDSSFCMISKKDRQAYNIQLKDTIVRNESEYYVDITSFVRNLNGEADIITLGTDDSDQMLTNDQSNYANLFAAVKITGIEAAESNSNMGSQQLGMIEKYINKRRLLDLNALNMSVYFGSKLLYRPIWVDNQRKSLLIDIKTMEVRSNHAKRIKPAYIEEFEAQTGPHKSIINRGRRYNLESIDKSKIQRNKMPHMIYGINVSDYPYRQSLSPYLSDTHQNLVYHESRISGKLTAPHIGQRKLLISEVQFLSNYVDDQYTVIYAGAAEGTHIGFLSYLFPNLSFVLYDSNTFKIKYEIDDIKIDKKRIKIVAQYLDDGQITKLRKRNEKYLLISDIRTFDASEGSNKQREQKLMDDMRLQESFHKKLVCIGSLLKFKLPWSEGETSYLDGKICLQAWSKPESTETRLYVSNLSNNAPKLYNNQLYEQQMRQFNLVDRYSYHEHSYINRSGLCPCFSCALEVSVWSSYINLPPLDSFKPSLTSITKLVNLASVACTPRGSDEVRKI